MNLGEIIKARRTEDKISLKQMSNYLGISESMLSRIENGERRFSEENLSKVSKYLKISEREIKVYWILDDIKTKFSIGLTSILAKGSEVCNKNHVFYTPKTRTLWRRAAIRLGIYIHHNLPLRSMTKYSLSFREELSARALALN